MKKTQLTAKTLQYALILALMVMFCGSAVVFYFVQKQLHTYAQETSQLNSQVLASEQNLNSLKKLQQYLKNHEDDIKLAKKVVGDSQNYQNDVLDEISSFAAKSGVTVLSYTFKNSSTGTTGSGSGGAPAPSGTPQQTPPSSSATGGGISGLKENTFTVTVKSPVSYRKLLEFISRIEQNVTRMQITSVSLVKDSSNSSSVSTESFEIGVYVR